MRQKIQRGLQLMIWIIMLTIWCICYCWLLDYRFEVQFHIQELLAYVLLVYFCMIRKIGNNTNRRYEIYVEAFGRLLSVNFIWLLFAYAFIRVASPFLSLIFDIILLTFIQTLVFWMGYNFYKMNGQMSMKALTFITKTDSEEVAKQKIQQGETIFLNDLPAIERNKYLKYCYHQGKQVYCTSKLSDILIRGSVLAQYKDTPVLFYDHFDIGLGERIVKRIFDFVGSFFGLILLSPLFLFLAILIKAQDGGPVIYKQTRCTKDMKTFTIYKFRSMVPDAESENGVQLAEKDDDRLTAIGGFLRKSKLDELPQLFNILKGEMSFVGPRPERPEFYEQTMEWIPEFDLRTKVKGGLTGYAQVMGKYNTNFLDKLKWDVMYIENYSLFLDMKILVMTITVLFQKDTPDEN